MAEPTSQTQLGRRAIWRGLFGDAATYTVSNIVNRVFPFLLLPVLTRYLSPAEYGTFVLFQVVVNFLLPIVGFNGDAAVTRAYVDVDRAALRRYVSTVILATIGTGVLVLAIVAPTARLLAAFLEVPALWLLVAVPVTIGESLKAVALSLWQMQKRARRYATFTVVQTAFRFGACLVPVMVLRARLNGLLWAYSLSLIAFAIYSTLSLVAEGWSSVVWNSQDLRSYLRYGIPLVPHRMSGWLTGMADRVIIARLASLGEVGIYSVGYSVGAAVALVQDAFNRAWVPFFFDRLKRSDPASRLDIVEFIYWYSLAMIAAAVGVMVAAHFLFPILGPRFARSEAFVGWIAFAYAVNGIYKMYANFLFYTEQTYVLSSITVSTGVFGVLVTIVLVKTSGVIGAGYALLLGQILACAAVVVAARRMFLMPWSDGLPRMASRVRALL